MEEVASSIGNTAVRIPFSGLGRKIVGHVVHKLLFDFFVENYCRKWTRGPSHATLPSEVASLPITPAPVDERLLFIPGHVLLPRFVQQLLDEIGATTKA